MSLFFTSGPSTLRRGPKPGNHNEKKSRTNITILLTVYHKPDDRPSLQELLREAQEQIQAEFPGESDKYIQEWVQYWLFDAAPIGASGSASGDELDIRSPSPSEYDSELDRLLGLGPEDADGGEPQIDSTFGSDRGADHGGGSNAGANNGGNSGDDALFGSDAGDADDGGSGGLSRGSDPASGGRRSGPFSSHSPPGSPRERLRRRCEADIGSSPRRIFNSASGLLCGLLALRDSLEAQLGTRHNWVAHPGQPSTYHAIDPPTLTDLLELHQELLNSNRWDQFIAAGLDDIGQSRNINVAVLGDILTTWGSRRDLK